MATFTVSLVEYLNSKPYAAGFEQHKSGWLEVVQDNPAKCADRLLAGEVDLGLVPIAILPELDPCYLLEGWGIGCDGAAGSVCLLSQKPIEKAEQIYLDYQSRSSNLLLQILCREHLRIDPTFIIGKANYEEEIKGSKAGLVIGDRALHLRHKYDFVYDLGTLWKELTGLPFVFAMWAGSKPLSDSKLSKLERCFNAAMEKKSLLAEQCQPDFAHYDTAEYLLENIKYQIDHRYLEALELFQTKSAPFIQQEKFVNT